MARTDVLSLPPELLDRVYAYLNWDPSEALYPSRPDIISITLTSRRLRESALPTLFRHVVLRLRWFDGALMEPALLRLRRYRPDLARHVRSVYMTTEFYRNHYPGFINVPFNVPEGLSDWIHPAPHLDGSEDFGERLQRQRVEAVAREVFKEPQLVESLSEVSNFIRERIGTFRQHILHGKGPQPTVTPRENPAAFFCLQNPVEEIFEDHVLPDDWNHGRYFADPNPVARNRRGQLDVTTLKFDALVVAILCFPPNVTSLAFRAHPRGGMHNLRNAFALHVAAAAYQIFGDRLQRLTMISSPLDTQRAGNFTSERHVRETSIVTDELLGELKTLSTLVISGEDGEDRSRPRNLMSEHELSWTQLSPTVVHLELWSCTHDKDGISQFIKRFEKLKTLALEKFTLFEARTIGFARRAFDPTMWLKWLIQLRRECPQLALRLGQLRYGRSGYGGHRDLPASAVRWLVNEAVPTNCSVSYDREDRLVEDFESFLELWIAEDGDRGAQAREARMDGRLVDEAMTNRWKTYAHLRKF